MNRIPESDRRILRQLANRQLELANSPENERILKQWKALEAGRREEPTVRLLFSNFCDEVITPPYAMHQPAGPGFGMADAGHHGGAGTV